MVLSQVFLKLKKKMIKTLIADSCFAYETFDLVEADRPILQGWAQNLYLKGELPGPKYCPANCLRIFEG